MTRPAGGTMTKRIHSLGLWIGFALPSCFASDSPMGLPGNDARILFVSDRDGPQQLYSIALDGAAMRRLTDAPDAEERNPSATRDGRVVYESVTDAGVFLALVSVDDPTSRRLTSGGHETEPAFCPEGNRIAFCAEDGSDLSIYILSPDRPEEATRISPIGVRDRSPAWSPDGRRLAFSSIVDGNEEIFVANTDGSDRERLTTSVGEDSRPTWSPDGEWIYFNAAPTGRHDEIHRVRPDGTGRRSLTGAGAIKGEFIDRNVANFDPAVSPDGATIAFVSVRTGNAELYLMRTDGSDVRRLTRHRGHDMAPTWWVGSPR